QHIDVAELVAEAGHAVVSQRVDHLVGELFARYVADRRMRLAPLHFMTDGLHEMRLTHTHAAIQEQRIIGLRWPLRYRQGRGMSELIAGADHKRVEGVT